MATRIAPSAMMPPTTARKPNAPTTRSESGMTVVKMLKKLGQMRGTTTVMVPHDNHTLEMADWSKRRMRSDAGAEQRYNPINPRLCDRDARWQCHTMTIQTTIRLTTR